MSEHWITVRGSVLSMRYNFAGLYMFEEVTGAEFDAKKMLHRHLMIWCMLRANNDGFGLSFDEFVDEMNKDANLSYTAERAFADMVTERAEMLEAVKKEDEKKSADGG